MDAKDIYSSYVVGLDSKERRELLELMTGNVPTESEPSNLERLADGTEQLKIEMVRTLANPGSGGDFGNEQLRSLRKRILGDPVLSQVAGAWLRNASTLEEAYALIRRGAEDQPDNGLREQQIVYDGLNPVLDAIRSRSNKESGPSSDVDAKGRSDALYRTLRDIEEFENGLDRLLG